MIANPPEAQPGQPPGERGATPLPLMRGQSLVRNHAGWAASLFLVTLGVKLCLLLILGTSLPFWDQWDGEGSDIYIPYIEGHLTAGNLLGAHNEHRILFTHLWDVTLLWLNGQWDNQFEAAMNALVHATWFSGFGLLLAHLMGRQNWPFIWLALALAALPPFAWENIVGGMQCQFYFLLVFSGLVLWWLGLGEPLSRRWWLGVAVAVAALFTMASGLFAAAAAAGMVLFEILKDRRSWRLGRLTLGIGLVVVLTGLITIPKMPSHRSVDPHSARDFLVAFGQNLAWPWMIHPWGALVNLFPLGLLAWRYFRSPEKRQRAQLMLLGIGLWVILQAAAIAVGRGGSGELPASRYMDSFSLMMVANALAIVLLLTCYAPRPRYRPIWTAGFAIWVAFCVSGLAWLVENTWYDAIPVWVLLRDMRLQTALAFRTTDNPQVIANVMPYGRPFPRVDELVQLLRNPSIQQILPACVRAPLKITRGDIGHGAFLTNGFPPAMSVPSAERSWGSYSETGIGATGVFESLPVNPSTLPMLEIPVTGDLGAPGLSLELIDLASGNRTPVKPARLVGTGWQSVYVKAPAGKFKVVARDESATGWFGFEEPRELGRFSYWTIRAVAAWKYFLIAGVGFLILESVRLFLDWRRAGQLRRKT